MTERTWEQCTKGSCHHHGRCMYLNHPMCPLPNDAERALAEHGLASGPMTEHPTDAMIEAGVKCYKTAPNLPRSHAQLCRQIYLAMEAARIKQPMKIIPAAPVVFEDEARTPSTPAIDEPAVCHSCGLARPFHNARCPANPAAIDDEGLVEKVAESLCVTMAAAQAMNMPVGSDRWFHGLARAALKAIRG